MTENFTRKLQKDKSNHVSYGPIPDLIFFYILNSLQKDFSHFLHSTTAHEVTANRHSNNLFYFLESTKVRDLRAFVPHVPRILRSLVPRVPRYYKQLQYFKRSLVFWKGNQFHK